MIYLTDVPDLNQPKKHNYFKEIQRLAKQFKPREIAHVDIFHDDWCNIYSGGYCNCNPHVKKRQDQSEAML